MDEDLFGYEPRKPGLARSTDPTTSRDAAKKIDATKLENAVWLALWDAGERGLTANEVVEITGIEYRSVSPRFKPLRGKGAIRLIIDSDGKALRRNGQQVHVATRKPE